MSKRKRVVVERDEWLDQRPRDAQRPAPKPVQRPRPKPASPDSASEMIRRGGQDRSFI